MRMYHIVICGLPVWFYYSFPTLPHKRYDFRKKSKQMRVFIFSTNYLEKFLIPRRTERDVIKCTNVLV
jgi:hypothetical protein